MNDAVSDQGYQPRRYAPAFQQSGRSAFHEFCSKHIVRPVGQEGPKRAHGQPVDEDHDGCEDRQTEDTIRDDPVDPVGYGQIVGAFLLVDAFQQIGDIDISLVGDDAFGIVIHFLFHGLDVFLDVRKGILVELEIFQDLGVSFEQLDRIPSLAFFRQIVNGRFFDVSQGVFDASAEGMQRDRLAVSGGFDRRIRRLVDVRPFQSGDADELHAHLLGQDVQIDLYAVLFDQIHHVDGDDDRNAQFRQLCGQIQVSFQVGTVNDVQDRIRSFSDQVFSGDHFFQSIRRKGIDARKVGDDHILVAFELTLFLFDGDARPVSDISGRAGKGVEEGGFATVGIAC